MCVCIHTHTSLTNFESLGEGDHVVTKRMWGSDKVNGKAAEKLKTPEGWETW